MAKKINYRAILASGHVVNRKSGRAYTHFWRASGRAASNGFFGGDSGFAGSRELAERALASAVARITRRAGKDVTIETEIVEASVEEPGCDLDSSATKPGFGLVAA